MNSETTTHNHEGFTPKEIITYSLLGVVVLGGSFFIGRRLVRKARSDSEEKKTYEEGNEATMAKQLKMAFDNDVVWLGN
jgi:NADH:ubiquinone oxidoreductase subunit 3 (subunit A)